MDSGDYLKNYLPDYDADERRSQLQQFSKAELIEMLITAYKQGRAWAMTADLMGNKLDRIRHITEETNELPSVNRPPSNF